MSGKCFSYVNRTKLCQVIQWDGRAKTFCLKIVQTDSEDSSRCNYFQGFGLTEEKSHAFLMFFCFIFNV